MVFEAQFLYKELQKARVTGDPVRIAEAQKRFDDWTALRHSDYPTDEEEVAAEVEEWSRTHSSERPILDPCEEDIDRLNEHLVRIEKHLGI